MKKAFIVLCMLFALFSPITAYAESGDTIVHRTKSGYAYHMADCYHLKSDIETTLRKAYEDGLSPCEHCKPPELDESEKAEIDSAKNIKKSSPALTTSSSSTSSTSVNTTAKSNGSATRSNSASTTATKNVTANASSDNWIWVGGTALFVGIVAMLYISSIKNDHKKEIIRVTKENAQALQDARHKIDNLENECIKFEKRIKELTADLEFCHEKNVLLSDTERIGKILQEFADMPENVKFTKDGLPYDVATTGKYGSFTVYVSKKGGKYHLKKGCSGAIYETHIIDAVNHFYSPCRNCCKGPYKIPGWYKAYMSLLKFLK